jgi:hypothetical protein
LNTGIELRKGFPLNLTEVESAVPLHKINDGVELPVYETSLIRDQCYPDDSKCLFILMVDFRDGDIESALQSSEQALDDAPLSFQRGYTLQMKLGFHHTNNHVRPLILDTLSRFSATATSNYYKTIPQLLHRFNLPPV